MRFLNLVFCLAFSMGLYAQTAGIQTVKDILAQQVSDWNRGDIDAFMVPYWHSDQLKFIGARGVTKGWQATLDNYKRGYPDKAAMGTLTFDLLSTEHLSKKVILVVGKWSLAREKDNPHGIYTLLWKKIKGEWVIIADHTSAE